jgi:hypothetical protein
MTSNVTTSTDVPTASRCIPPGMREYIERTISDLLTSLPDPQQLSPVDRRGIIARYTAVLEGNFVYWMSSAYLSVKSWEAHQIIDDNLREEVRDNHPGMLRRFAMAAHAVPTDTDILAVHDQVHEVRKFVGRLRSESILPMMAFFEGFIQKFMPYLTNLAIRQGSSEVEYTDVHGVVDVGHTEELYRALNAEVLIAQSPLDKARMLEGVEILRKVLETVIHYRNAEKTKVAVCQ